MQTKKMYALQKANEMYITKHQGNERAQKIAINN